MEAMTAVTIILYIWSGLRRGIIVLVDVFNVQVHAALKVRKAFQIYEHQ